MNIRTTLTCITFSLFLFSCNTSDLNLKNTGNIRITLNPLETQSKIKKMAVLPFNTHFATKYESQGRIFADVYAKEFERIGYNCIDTNTISKIMKEQSLNPDEPVDMDTAIIIGKLSGAEGVVIADVIKYPYSDACRYQIKFANVETGKFIWRIDALNDYRSQSQITERLKNRIEL